MIMTPHPARHPRTSSLPWANLLAVLLSGYLLQGSFAGEATNSPALVLAKPSAEQIAFMDLELGAFFHFDLNTFTGQEHGDGFEPASKFAPTALDVDQWVRTAKAMGAKYAVLTARHEGGFCLWPTATTDYSIVNSPYQNGKGDIVREFVDACRKHGLKVGFYHTAAFDAHATYKPEDKGQVIWGKPADALRQKRFDEMGEEGLRKYREMQIAQLTELLTRYGPIDYLWFDHYGCHNPSTRIWDAVTKAAKQLQPHCLIGGVDVTTPGNEAGWLAYPLWNGVYPGAKNTSQTINLPDGKGSITIDQRSGSPFGKMWRIREADTSSALWTGGWFWHPGRKKPQHTTCGYMDVYDRTIGLGANLIINLPPDDRGLIQEDMAETVRKFGADISRRFDHPVAVTTSIPPGDVAELGWDQPCRIDTIVTMENLAEGQKILSYAFEALVEGKWVPLKPANNFPNPLEGFKGSPGFETVGHKKIDRVEPVVTNRIRFRCTRSLEAPVSLRSIAVYQSN
jgi:alpha-L-fucosidase